MVIEANGTVKLFQNCAQFLVQTGFLMRGDMAVYDNAATHAKGDNDMLTDVLTSVGIDSMPLPTCSPEFNPIELTFNMMVQRFASACNESNAKTNGDAIRLLNKIIDSISPDIMLSSCKKSGYDDFH